MSQLNVEFTARSAFGKGSAKKLRREGFVPCVVSSEEFGSALVSLPRKVVDKMAQSSRFLSQIVDSSLDSKANIKIIPIKVEFHPVNGSVLHIDFKHVTTEEITVQVPVKIIGADKAPGLKKGGKLNLVKYHVPLCCKVDSIPENVQVNISTFGVGRSVFLSGINLPSGAKMAYDCLILSITGRGKKEKGDAEGSKSSTEAK